MGQFYIKFFATLFCLLLIGCSSVKDEDDKPIVFKTNNPDEQPKPTPQYIRFLTQSGHISQAFSFYQSLRKEKNCHDFELLRELCLILLKRGAQKNDLEIELSTIYGAGITANETVLPILQNGINSPFLEVQLASLNFLFALHNDAADESITKAMSSNFLLSRLEAARYLAIRKHYDAIGQIDALIEKLPEQIKPIFPELFAIINTPRASQKLKLLLNDTNEQTQVQAILSAGYYQHYDLLPQIHKLATHLNVSKQEACAITLGILEDRDSLDRLKELTKSPTENIRLAALNAIYNLGDTSVVQQIFDLAKNKNIFAINILGEIPDSEDVLASLLNDSNIQVRINAAIALLEKKDPRCQEVLYEILISDIHDMYFSTTFSASGGMLAWKAIANIPSKQIQYLKEIRTNIREYILTKSLNLPEEIFLEIASKIFNAQENALVPTLVSLLENLRTETSIKLLKKEQQRLGSPLIRNYCNLTLFRLNEGSFYEEQIKRWVQNEWQTDILIQFRPFIPENKNKKQREITPYQLTPEETSRLLIDTLKTLASKQNEYAIDLLLEIMEKGNKKNRYALAGLLWIAIE